MDNLSLLTQPETGPADPTASVGAARKASEEVLLVASFGEPAAADYVDYIRRQGVLTPRLTSGARQATSGARVGHLKVAVLADAVVRRQVGEMVSSYALEDATQATFQSAAEQGKVKTLVLFLNSQLTGRDRLALNELLSFADEQRTECVLVVTSFSVHLGDLNAVEVEAYVLDRLKGMGIRTVVFRPGHVLSRHSRACGNLRRLGFIYPLVPRRMHGCCVDGDDLFAAIEEQRQHAATRRMRVFAMPGPNRPWREWLAQHWAKTFLSSCLTAICTLLSIFLLGHVATLVVSFLARRRPGTRCWNVGILRPGSFKELLAIYNQYSWRDLKVVGYNNGVVHFGQQYPGKTIVSIVCCNRAILASPDQLKADCGTTVRKALDYLAGRGLELPVVPNYSYVCLGTSFFIPIHGSAADFSTVADTITRVLLYDAVGDRFIAAANNQPAFRDGVYNLKPGVLLLRLHLQVRPRSRYFVHKEMVKNPSAEDLLNALRDRSAANVEIRKSRAGSDTVSISRYFKDPGQTPGPVLELPRDSLGRLWDRLEENTITSYLMHAMTRHFAWHLELFFTAAEFATFWQTHGPLPLRKIQLRYIRRDGLTHSPFRECDCVAVDLFMFRRHRRRFEAYLRANFSVVRTNPGKHSR